uniref:SAM domain-containing protein n=1 Tax=Ananas comosus var. bracteatus TaxID=296719 RepID=A0A6V7P4F0_ANACO|nr:unnamed protein product [Ananas comosus var. bracteatus]
MDWYSWLSKSSSLDPSLVYEYSVLFSRNELDADDIADFDHDFLRSMGVSIAKHRLHILRLANKHKNGKNIKINATTTKPKSIINNHNNNNNSITTTTTSTTPHYYYRYYMNTNTGSSSRDSPSSRPAVSRLLAAISKTTNCLARYIRSLAPPRADDDADASAIVAAAPRHESRGRRRTAAMLKRGRWGAACSGGRTDARRSRQPMMITDGRATARRFHDGCGPPSLGGVEIRWDCMFEGLKPT